MFNLLRTFINIELRNYIEYPLNFAISIAYTFIGTLFYYFIWAYIINQGLLQIYSIKTLTLYMFFVISFNYSVDWSYKQRNLIITGKITTYTTKMSITYFFFYKFFSTILVLHFFNIFITIIIGILFIGIQSILGIIVWLFGLIIGTLIVVIILLSDFWFGRNWAIFYMFSFLITIVNGALIPLDLFSKTTQQIFYLLPFKFMFYIPAKVFLNQYQITIALFFEYIFWIVVLYCVARILEYYGLKRYEQLGG